MHSDAIWPEAEMGRDFVQKYRYITYNGKYCTCGDMCMKFECVGAYRYLIGICTTTIYINI
jgi:hypothetical protein